MLRCIKTLPSLPLALLLVTEKPRPGVLSSPDVALPSVVPPVVILTDDYVVARFHVGEIDEISDDCGATRNCEVLPIREPHVEVQVSLLVSVRNPVHFLAVNLRVPSSQLFVLLLDSPVQPPVFCQADRLYRNTVDRHGLGFFLLRHARSPALCSRHPKRVAAGHLFCGWSAPLRFF